MLKELFRTLFQKPQPRQAVLTRDGIRILEVVAKRGDGMMRGAIEVLNPYGIEEVKDLVALGLLEDSPTWPGSHLRVSQVGHAKMEKYLAQWREDEARAQAARAEWLRKQQARYGSS